MDCLEIKTNILNCIANIIIAISAIVGVVCVPYQIKVTRETNNRPLLKLINCRKGIEDNDYIDYQLGLDGGGYILSFKNEGVGIARDIQIYSLNVGANEEQLKTIVRKDEIINDLEIDKGNTESINIKLSSVLVENNKNYNFCITYKNIYKDMYYGVLSITDIGDTTKAMFFNEGSNGYNTIIKSFPAKFLIENILKKSKDPKNSNWIIDN